MSIQLHSRRGPALSLAVSDWTAPATAAERALLDEIEGPVLDLGCGPGRLVVALAERGTAVLGVDSSPAAAHLASGKGVPVLCRSVFDPLPGEGRWRSLLLFDGNIGIGGDPARLLKRCRSLVAPRASVFVEADPPGSTTSVTDARVAAYGQLGPWFPWAWVAADRLDHFAAAAGLAVAEWLRPDERWVARLEAPAP